jgi:hypothetical protein
MFQGASQICDAIHFYRMDYTSPQLYDGAALFYTTASLLSEVLYAGVVCCSVLVYWLRDDAKRVRFLVETSPEGVCSFARSLKHSPFLPDLTHALFP